MRSLFIALALAASASCSAAASPCLPDAEAVFKAHPGVHVHADWHYIDDVKCWMAKGEFDGRHRSHVLADNRGDGGSTSRHMPTPRERPAAKAPAPLVLTPAKGKLLADEIWSWPDMQSAPDRSLYERAKVLLAKALREPPEKRAAKVAEWQR